MVAKEKMHPLQELLNNARATLKMHQELIKDHDENAAATIRIINRIKRAAHEEGVELK